MNDILMRHSDEIITDTLLGYHPLQVCLALIDHDFQPKLTLLNDNYVTLFVWIIIIKRLLVQRAAIV